MKKNAVDRFFGQAVNVGFQTDVGVRIRSCGKYQVRHVRHFWIFTSPTGVDMNQTANGGRNTAWLFGLGRTLVGMMNRAT